MSAEGAPRRRGAGRKLLLVLASLAAALAVAEIVLRVWHPVTYRRPVVRPPGHGWTDVIHRPASTPGLTYELRPGASGREKDCQITVNSLGMRGPELVQPKSNQTLRVAVLGDSVAFGFRVEQHELFPARLETLLNATPGRARDYEVMNFAVTGYSAREQSIVLERKALPLDPDLVLVAYYPNDPDFGPVNALRMAFHDAAWWERSELLRLLAQKAHQAELARAGGGDYYRWLHAPETDEWKSVPAAFARMRELAGSRALRVVLAIFPVFALDGATRTPFQTWDEYAYAPIHAQVRAAAEAERFVVLDLLDVYRASGKAPPELARDPDHPNALGHALAAEALAHLLLERHEELFGAPK